MAKMDMNRQQMSHTVTVTRTTTSTTTSAIILNTGYCKTAPGLLKIAEVIVGLLLFIVLFFLFPNRGYWANYYPSQLYLLLVVFGCLLGSLCLLISCLFSLSTSSIIAKTLYEFVFHGVAFVLYGLSVAYYYSDRGNRTSDHPYSTAGILGIVLVILYLASTILAYRSYRGV